MLPPPSRKSREDPRPHPHQGRDDGEQVRRPDDGAHALSGEVCRSCGACCAFLRVGFPAWETAGQGGAVPAGLVEPWIRGHVRMRGTAASPPRCAALDGVVGQHTTCTIHGHHPVPCRDLAPSTPEAPNRYCDDARRAHGLVPLSEGPVPRRKRRPPPPEESD